MARIPAAVAETRRAVRRALTSHDAPVLVACSGGADSLALAAAARFVGRHVGLVTVDHGLQAGSGTRAQDVAGWARTEGFDPVRVATVSVAGLPGGPEAAARTARYAALTAAATAAGAETVLLGHTRDDQAETVLLALARGSGPRGLSGMPRRRGLFLRPLLDVARAVTRQACADLKLTPWEDPHNADPAYARARVRGALLPALVEQLGPGVVGNLARSAEQIAADHEVLAGLAADALVTASRPGGGLGVPALAALPAAIRTRVLHSWARELGAPGGALSHRHVAALDALVTGWHGQGPADLPGGVRVARRADELVPAGL